MADKMWKNIFLSLLIIGTILHRLTSLPIDCVKRVQKCPVEKDQWTQKNNLLKCAANYGYVCLRDSDGYLFETCMAKFPVQANSGNCPILYACKNNKAYLGPAFAYYPCPEEVSGCPPKNHQEYRIQQLYRYPRCIESNFSVEIGNTSPKLTISVSETTRGADYVKEKGNIHVISIVTTAVLSIVALFLIFRELYLRNRHHGPSHITRDKMLSLTEGYSIYTYGEIDCISEGAEEKRIKHLQRMIIERTESEADTVLFLQNEYKIEVDRTYGPVSIVDEYEKHITLDNMFYVQQKNEKKRARFVFMLGDVRYVTTIQCQRISKLWCQTWKNEYLEESSRLEKERNDLEVKYSERSLNDFDFLFYIRMGSVNDTNVSLIDMIQDAYSSYLSKEQINDIRMILEGEKCKCLVLLDGLDEWNISEKKKISDRGIPNCRDMPNCTIFITMSSWKFKDVEHICRQKFVKVVRLHRTDDHNTRQLTTNGLCNHFYMERKGKDHQSNIPDFTWNHEYLNAVSSFNSAEILNENIFITSYLNSHMV